MLLIVPLQDNQFIKLTIFLNDTVLCTYNSN